MKFLLWLSLLALCFSCTNKQEANNDTKTTKAGSIEAGEDEPPCDDPDEIAEKIREATKENSDANKNPFSLTDQDGGCELEKQ